MHQVLGGIVDLDRLERSRADVQHDVGARDAARGERREQLRREVQPRRRRRDRSRFAREHRLVPLDVARGVGPLDVRRQRNVSVSLDRLVEREVALEANDARSSLGHLENLRREVRRDRRRADRA